MNIADGFKCLYDREVPFELRIHDGEGGPQEVGTLEAIRVKVLVQVSYQTPCFTDLIQLTDDGREATQFRVELTSENDLFFHYTAMYP